MAECPYTEEQYKEALAYLEKYDHGNIKPTDEELLANYDADQYSDEQIFQDLQKDGVGFQKPDFDKILSKAKESIVLVDNIPTTTKEKFEKLKQKVEEKIEAKKVEKRASFEIKDKFYPFYENKEKNEPYCLFQLGNEQQATEFKRYIEDLKMTKSSIWKTYDLATIDKYLTAPDVWEKPKIKEKTFDKTLEKWQEDDNDHFLVLAGNNTEVYRNKVLKEMAPTGPEKIALRAGIHADWRNVRWSPQGNYLLVIDARFRGVGLFVVTENGFEIKERFTVERTFNAEFSPDEKYIRFQSGYVDHEGMYIDHPTIKPKISIYSVLENEEKKAFRFSPGSYCADIWERFQWSADGRYLGTTKKDYLCIFDAHNGFKPVSVKGSDVDFINVPGLHSFLFSPADNYVCYWVPEADERPLKVVVRDITTLNIIRTKNLYKVRALEMKWHPQGTYLALRCSKPMKGNKQSLQSSFELFHIKEKDVPIDVIECEQYVQHYDPLEPTRVFDKQPIGGYEWEPNGNRFAVFYGPNDLVTKTVFKIYKPQIGNKIKELPKFERTSNHNSIHWCPTGRYLVLAQFKKQAQSGGALEWIDVDGETMQDANKYIKAKNKDLRKPTTIKVEASGHQFMTNLTWDVTGRYVVTSSSMYEHKMENGYIMWNFQGKMLYHKKLDGFCDFSWRPRPKTSLSVEQLKEIKTNIKEYARKFQESDAIKQGQVSDEEQDKLLTKINDYNARRNHYLEQRQMMADYYKELDGEVDDHIEEVEVLVRLNEDSKIVSRQVQ